jgi:ubiquinone/menaquinone biosynthesis C-methylase UbiE
MKEATNITLQDVQGVYSGAEGKLWELIMGEQIHIGGFVSSMELAERAGIRPGMSGVDFCCCTGAGMRFLVRFRGVERMHGVDATETVVEEGRKRCAQEGLDNRIQFALADVCASGGPAGEFDFVWGEDAWCYVVDKRQLIREAVRLLKPGGTIAFTDWVEGSPPLTADESNRCLSFMKFPNILTLDEYVALLSEHGCEIVHAEDTGRFAPYMDLYMFMIDKQLTYDALKTIGFDVNTMKAVIGEMQFMQKLAHEGKIAQGLIVAKKGT